MLASNFSLAHIISRFDRFYIEYILAKHRARSGPTGGEVSDKGKKGINRTAEKEEGRKTLLAQPGV